MTLADVIRSFFLGPKCRRATKPEVEEASRRLRQTIEENERISANAAWQAGVARASARRAKTTLEGAFETLDRLEKNRDEAAPPRPFRE